MCVCFLLRVHFQKRHDAVKSCLPMRGTEEAAGGVESASRRSNKKKATNMFIPGEQTIGRECQRITSNKLTTMQEHVKEWRTFYFGLEASRDL